MKRKGFDDSIDWGRVERRVHMMTGEMARVQVSVEGRSSAGVRHSCTVLHSYLTRLWDLVGYEPL